MRATSSPERADWRWFRRLLLVDGRELLERVLGMKIEATGPVRTRWGWRDAVTGQWCGRPTMTACEPGSETARHFHHFVTHRTVKADDGGS